jgi:hypothetical protein
MSTRRIAVADERSHVAMPEHQSPNAVAAISHPTLAELVQSPDDFVGKHDVGTFNLICALGLPGAEDLDIVAHQQWLDDAARQVDLQTRGHFDQFARNPGTYNNSPGQFCCNYLLRTLQELLGVRYNPARVTDSDFQSPLCVNPDFRDSRDLFIHGMINGPGGTCASMPVMYVAVGRRFGWPLKLVEAPGHLFFRWEDPEGRIFNVPEVFNVEGAGSGIGFYPDDFYRTWPREWSRKETAGDWYLRSLSPVEELAAFLATRGACLEDNGRALEAIQAFDWVVKLMPDDLRYESHLVKLLKRRYQDGIEALESERHLLDMDRMLLDQQQCRVHGAFVHAGGPPHGDYCQCLNCLQARDVVQRPHTPGHPAGCGCVHCQRAGSNSFSPR